MRPSLRYALLLYAGLVVSGCDDGSSDDEASTSGASETVGDSDGGGGESGGLPSCADGCMRSIALHCENGPTDQAGCEADCEMLLAGACAAAYETWQRCGGPMGELACGDDGLVTIVGCEDDRAAFLACLNG